MSEEFWGAQRQMPEPDDEEPDEDESDEEPDEESVRDEFDALLARTFQKLKEQRT